MLRYLKTIAILGVSCGTALPALAQDFVTERAMRPGQVETIQSTFNATIPLDDTKDITTQHLEWLRNFYKMASGSCSEALASVADNCEILRLTTGINIRDNGAKGPLLTITGTVTMKVDFKKGEAKPAE